MFCSQGPWPLQWTDFCHPTAHGPMGLGRGNCEMRTNAIYRIFLERTMGTISTRNCCWREPLCIRHTAHACGCKQGYPKNELFSWYFWKGHSWILQNVFCFEKRWLWLLSASVLNNSQHKVFHDKCFFFLKQNPTHPDHKSFYYPMISLGIVKTKIFSFVVQESS